MTLSNLKPLALALAVTVALAACQKDDASTAATDADATAATATTDAAPADPLAAVKTPSIAFNVADLDSNIAACSDLGAHVNGTWLAANPVPADRTTWGSFEVLGDRSLELQHAIVQDLAAREEATGTAKLIGDVWATGMDETAIETAGLTPLQPILDEIAKLDSAESIAEWLRTSYSKGRGYVFGFGPNPDFQDPSINIAYAGQSGLGLPDRDYYFADEYAKQREAYVAHIANILKLAGADEATAKQQADDVMTF